MSYEKKKKSKINTNNQTFVLRTFKQHFYDLYFSEEKKIKGK